MRLGRLVLLLVVAGLLILTRPPGSSAQNATTISAQAHGTLIGVGPGQRRLIVEWTNTGLPGCGVYGVTSSTTATSTSVTVTLTAQVDVLAPGTPCGGVGQFGSVTETLAAPLGGRAINGVQLLGGAFLLPRQGALTMPDLVGLSPNDARIMVTQPDIPARDRVIARVVIHRRHAKTTRRLARVIAQRPAADKPIRPNTTVVLTVAP